MGGRQVWLNAYGSQSPVLAAVGLYRAQALPLRTFQTNLGSQTAIMEDSESRLSCPEWEEGTAGDLTPSPGYGIWNTDAVLCVRA